MVIPVDHGICLQPRLDGVRITTYKDYKSTTELPKKPPYQAHKMLDHVDMVARSPRGQLITLTTRVVSLLMFIFTFVLNSDFLSWTKMIVLGDTPPSPPSSKRQATGLLTPPPTQRARISPFEPLLLDDSDNEDW